MGGGCYQVFPLSLAISDVPIIFFADTSNTEQMTTTDANTDTDIFVISSQNSCT